MKKTKENWFVDGLKFQQATIQYTTTELSEATGVSESTLRNFEHSSVEKPHPPSRAVLRKLDRVLDIKHEYYVVRVPQPVVVNHGLFNLLARCSAVPAQELPFHITVEYTPNDDGPWRKIGEGIVYGATDEDPPPPIALATDAATWPQTPPHASTPMAPSSEDIRRVWMSDSAPPLGGDCIPRNGSLPSTKFSFVTGSSSEKNVVEVTVPLSTDAKGPKVRFRLQILMPDLGDKNRRFA